MSSWSGYPKIFGIGHNQVADIFRHVVLITEKIDGSQFSFGLVDGRLRIKSHHQDISDIEGEYGLFTEAIAYVRSLHAKGLLHEGWTYRGEVLQKPMHNKLAYDRVPKHNIIGFDVAIEEEKYLAYTDLVLAFAKLDLEVVPYYWYGMVENPATIKTFLDRRPILGGKFIEGLVIKAYGHYGEDKKTLMAKYVSDAFKEVKNTGEYQPGIDFMQELIEDYRSEARWEKAIQRAMEAGTLTREARDIGPLIGSIISDLKEEEGAAIASRLMKRYWPSVARGCTGGFAEWYKRRLQDQAFAQDSQVPKPIETTDLIEVKNDPSTNPAPAGEQPMPVVPSIGDTGHYSTPETYPIHAVPVVAKG